MGLMEITVSVSLNGEFTKEYTTMKVPEAHVYAFEPINVTDNPFTAMATGEDMPGTAELTTKLRRRNDAAEIISEAITKMLIEKMEKNDKYNGNTV